MADVMYATREQVQDSLEVFSSARIASLVDRKIRASSRSMEGYLHRRFYPEQRSVKFDWPNYTHAPTWTVWLGQHTLISLTSVVSGGITIPLGNVLLRRHDDLREPPYTKLEIDLSSSSSLMGGLTFQESLVITGLYGDNDTDNSYVDGELGTSINNSVKTVVLVPSSGSFEVGVGSIVLMEDERMIVLERAMSDTTRTITGNIDDSQNAETIPVSSGAAFAVGETILIDAERMKVVDIASNNLIVRRAWDASTLDTHTSGAAVYALRTCLVQRGALGTTATSHTAAVTFSVHRFNQLINDLCVAESVVALEQNASGYARTVGSGGNAREATGAGLEDLRKQACSAYGRIRSGAV